MKKIQSRLKFSISTSRFPHKKRAAVGGSLENFILARNFQSRRLDFPHKKRAAVGGSLEMFNLARKFQSRRLDSGSAKLSTTTAREQNRALGPKVYGRYPNPGKHRKNISTIAFARLAKIWSSAVVVDSSVLPAISPPKLGPRWVARSRISVSVEIFNLARDLEFFGSLGPLGTVYAPSNRCYTPTSLGTNGLSQSKDSPKGGGIAENSWPLKAYLAL